MIAPIDVFESGLRLPPKVCILAPGPNGKSHHKNIPKDFYLIAVSKAVLISDVKTHLWMMNHADQDWYLQANEHFDGIRVFGDQAFEDAGPLLNEKKDCFIFFPLKGQQSLEHIAEVEGVIRIGGTIVGSAIQFAYNFGAKEILLCGADLYGVEYFDNTINLQPDHEKTWPIIANLNTMIQWLTETKGIKITTLSPTKLNVPFHK